MAMVLIIPTMVEMVYQILKILIIATMILLVIGTTTIMGTLGSTTTKIRTLGTMKRTILRTPGTSTASIIFDINLIKM
jgi:hypothetical protein